MGENKSQPSESKEPFKRTMLGGALPPGFDDVLKETGSVAAAMGGKPASGEKGGRNS